MKKNNNRDYFYQDYQVGYQSPLSQMPNPMMQNGYMMNNNYAPFNPNILPNQYQNNDTYSDADFENRITKLERQVRKLDAKISKLENDTNIVENDDNLYII